MGSAGLTRETYLSIQYHSASGGGTLAPWGKKRQKVEEALEETKALIIRIKKKGVDTTQAQKLYKEAKDSAKNRDFGAAMEGLELAEKSAKRAYARTIRETLSDRTAKLEACLSELEKKNLDTRKVKNLYNKAQTALEKGVAGYKTGLSVSKEGLAVAEKQLERHAELTEMLSTTAFTLRRMEDKNPELSIIPPLSERISALEALMTKGKVEQAMGEARNLESEVKGLNARFLEAHEAVLAFGKVVRDVEVLGANIEMSGHLEKARSELSGGRFKEAQELARTGESRVKPLLRDFREAQHHVDIASAKVTEAKGWGFSAFDAETTLLKAREALGDNRFEEARSLAQEALEKASTIRERHKASLAMINSAREEIARLEAAGSEVADLEGSLKEAEDIFYKGDYSSSDKKVRELLDTLRNRDD